MKRKALCMALSVCVLALGGCGGGETDVAETQAPVQTTSAYDTMRQQDPTEAVAETTAPAESGRNERWTAPEKAIRQESPPSRRRVAAQSTPTTVLYSYALLNFNHNNRNLPYHLLYRSKPVR